MMKQFKNCISVLFLSCFLIPAVHAQADPDSLVNAGNRYYMQKDYQNAAACYTKVLNMGYQAADLYFNTGNAWYKLNNIPRAILYYEKAKLLKPADEDIKQNLMIANARIVDKIDAIPEFFIKRWLVAFTGMFSPDQWAVISLILFAFSLSAFFIYMTSGSYALKRAGSMLGILGLVLSLSGLMMMHSRKHSIRNSHGAIVMSPVVNVKSSPDLQGTSVFVLHEGTKVNVIDSVQQWKEVRIPDGNKGWIQNKDLASI
jgi:tetratricopeptide (TPR) repeat protein